MSNHCCLYIICIMVVTLFSCTEKYQRGDFTIIVEKEKYESLGGALKTDSYDILYQGKPLDWSKYMLEEPEVWNTHYLESDPTALIAEVMNGYYLLKPAGQTVNIIYLAEASSRNGLFNSKPYTELLNRGQAFHQAGRLVNLTTLAKDSMEERPPGRLLANNKDLLAIIYLDGVFGDDTDLKKTLDQAAQYSQTGVYNYQPPGDRSVLKITEWDVKRKKVYQYSLTDTALWNACNTYYDKNNYSVLSDSFDSSFVFSYFNWAADTAGIIHLLPKTKRIQDIQFENMEEQRRRDSLVQAVYK